MAKNKNVLVNLLSQLNQTKSILMNEIKQNEDLLNELPNRIENWIELEKTMRAASEEKQKQKRERNEKID